MPQYRLNGNMYLNRQLSYPAVEGAGTSSRQHASVHDPDSAGNGII